MKLLKKIIIIYCSSIAQSLYGYGLPELALGATNVLEGGPVRPSPGFYYIQYLGYYHSNKFTDQCGNTLQGIKKPNLNIWAGVSQFIYQSHRDVIPNAKGGLDVTLTYFLSSTINKNQLGIKNSGAGLGNLITGAYFQWNPTMINDRPLFVHRVEFPVFWGIGKNQEPCKLINPSTNYTFFNPYWAATLFLTTQWAASWRLSYLWTCEDRKLHLKAGDAFLMNYSMEWRIAPQWWVAASGYFLQQLKNNKQCSIEVPHSKERVIGIGPSLVYFCPDRHCFFFTYLYFEQAVRNRPQGISLIFRFIKHF